MFQGKPGIMKCGYSIISTLLLGTAISCCTHSPDWMGNIPEHNLDYRSEVLWTDIPTDSIGIPGIMASFGNYILWSEESGNAPVTVYDMSQDICHKPARKGRAKGELLNVNQIIPVKDGFAIADNFRKTLQFFRYSKEEAGFVCVSERGISEFSTVAVARDTIVGVLSTGKGRFGLKAAGSELLLTTFGDYSAYGLSDRTGWGLMQGHLCINESAGRIATFSYYTAAYDIVDYRDTSIVRSKVLDMSHFNDNGQMYASMRPDSKVGFISLASNDKSIFSLYDGKELSYYMAHRGMKPRGNDILVFDWNGQCVGRLYSEFPISCIAWNEDMKVLLLCVMLESGEYRIGLWKGFADAGGQIE